MVRLVNRIKSKIPLRVRDDLASNVAGTERPRGEHPHPRALKLSFSARVDYLERDVTVNTAPDSYLRKGMRGETSVYPMLNAASGDEVCFCKTICPRTEVTRPCTCSVISARPDRLSWPHRRFALPRRCSTAMFRSAVPLNVVKLIRKRPLINYAILSG